MKLILVLSFIAVCCISSCAASDLMVGSSYNTRLVWQQKMEYMGIPFKKRVKEFFYSDPAQQVIRGVIARETTQTQGLPTVTAGGVGFPFVNIRFKSERGSAINYNVEIYV